MIATCLPEMAERWRNQGTPVKKLYTADGITHWQIHAEQMEVDEQMRDAKYVGLVIKEQMLALDILHKRMAPSLFTVKSGGRFADVVDAHGKRCVPLARDKKVLKVALTNPFDGKCPKLVKLGKLGKVLSVLKKAQQGGTERIQYFVAPGFAEAIEIKTTIDLLTPSDNKVNHESARSSFPRTKEVPRLPSS